MANHAQRTLIGRFLAPPFLQWSRWHGIITSVTWLVCVGGHDSWVKTLPGVLRSTSLWAFFAEDRQYSKVFKVTFSGVEWHLIQGCLTTPLTWRLGKSKWSFTVILSECSESLWACNNLNLSLNRNDSQKPVHFNFVAIISLCSIEI